VAIFISPLTITSTVKSVSRTVTLMHIDKTDAVHSDFWSTTHWYQHSPLREMRIAVLRMTAPIALETMINPKNQARIFATGYSSLEFNIFWPVEG